LQGVLREARVIWFDIDGVKGHDLRSAGSSMGCSIEAQSAEHEKEAEKGFRHPVSSVARRHGIRL
jgi:hypothetical protein